MKVRIVYVIWTALIFSACKKNDLPRVPDPISYGTISFEDVLNSPSTTTVSTQDKNKTLDVYSVMCAPNGNNMQTRIYAWNGYNGAEFRALLIYINGGFDDFPLENPNVSFTFYKGELTQTLVLANQPDYLIQKEDFIPAFTYPQGTYTSGVSVTKPLTFSQFQINVAAKDRKIRASIPELVIGSDTLRSFEIDIHSFGGTLLASNKCLTFDVNDKPAGSFEDQPFKCVKNETVPTPGILQLKGTFTPDSRNPLVSLTFDFVHHSSKLAYNGPVGRYDLNDGTGYTEIKITAEDQSGRIFREQKGKGFVRTHYERPWSKFFNGAQTVFTEGWILLEFSADLISDDGTVLSLKNGNAYYTCRWD